MASFDDHPEGERTRFIAQVRARAAAAGITCQVQERSAAALQADDRHGAMRRDVVLLSMGNALEAHGPALAPDIDDRTAIAVASAVANHTGARYLGHVPYCTDGLGPVAQAWSPTMRPVESFLQATIDFVEILLRHGCDRQGLARPALAVLISGHGGNQPLAEHLDELATALGLRACRYLLSMRLPDSAAAAGHQIQHAGSVEHSVAAALGSACLDGEGLAAAQDGWRDDATLLRTLLRYPALGGMAGYYLFGDQRFDPVRARYDGVKASVRELWERRQLLADPALGRQVLDHSIRAIAEEVRRAAADTCRVDVPTDRS